MCKIRFSLLILIKFDWVSGVNCEISFHSRKTKFVYVERIFGEAVFVQCWFMPKELDACSFPVPRMQTLDLPFDVLGTVLIIYILISINASVSLLFMDLGIFSVLSDACKSHTYHGYHLARDLGNSNLSGHLVPELGKLEHLQYLELYKNKIQGSIPVELGNLKSLISLDLYNNNISGRIPPSLGNLKSLVFLRLNDNQLNGPIPKSLASISTLKVVDVSNNNLCGPIPTTGSFEHIPLNNFENNPRLEGPELQGLASYDTNCS